MKLGAALLFSALSLSAQTVYEIRGVVREPSLGVISGAEVLASAGGGRSPTELTALTNVSGQFVFRTTTPGRYVFLARMAGYGLPLERTAALVDGDHPRVEVEVRMVRLGQVTGRVLDAKTRDSVESIDVRIMSRQSDDRGNSRWTSALPQVVTAQDRDALARQMIDDLRTKKDGSFSMSNLMPGEYAATVAVRQESPWSLGFSADDLKSFDEEVALLYWPGGVSAEAVRPVSVAPGAVASVGDIFLEKKRHYRAHVSLSQGTCPSGESMRLTLFQRESSSTSTQVAPCGSELLLGRLTPGSYIIYGVSDWQGYRDSIDNAAWATAEFEISDKNIEVTVVPRPGAMVDVRLVAADGVTGLPDQVTLISRPEPILPGVPIPPEDFSERLPDGRIRMAVSPRAFDASLYLNLPFYLKLLRYNGAPIPGTRVPLNPGSPAQQLEIVIDNRLGTLTGSAPNAPQPFVYLWSEADPTVPSLVPIQDGSFRKDNLVPGDYRVSTLSSDYALSWSNVKVGKPVTIRAGEVTTLDLR